MKSLVTLWLPIVLKRKDSEDLSKSRQFGLSASLVSQRTCLLPPSVPSEIHQPQHQIGTMEGGRGVKQHCIKFIAQSLCRLTQLVQHRSLAKGKIAWVWTDNSKYIWTKTRHSLNRLVIIMFLVHWRLEDMNCCPFKFFMSAHWKGFSSIDVYILQFNIVFKDTKPQGAVLIFVAFIRFYCIWRYLYDKCTVGQQRVEVDIKKTYFYDLWSRLKTN